MCPNRRPPWSQRPRLPAYLEPFRSMILVLLSGADHCPRPGRRPHGQAAAPAGMAWVVVGPSISAFRREAKRMCDSEYVPTMP